MDKKGVLKLYRKMLKASKNFEQYNFREYSKRRVRDGFKENKAVNDQKRLKELIIDAQDNLGVIERQSKLSQLYIAPDLVIEKK